MSGSTAIVLYGESMVVSYVDTQHLSNFELWNPSQKIGLVDKEDSPSNIIV